MKIFIENSRLVILISLAFVLLGIKGLRDLKREAIPPVDFARAFITTIYPGSSSNEVEELITKKIEDEIRSVSHLKDVKSHSAPSISTIDIRIDIDNSGTQEVINEIHQKLQNVKGLPEEVLDPPRLIHLDSTKRKPILVLHLSGSDKNLKKDKYSRLLKEQLENIEGVLEVQLFNYKKREFQILLLNDKMNQYHISSSDIVSALQKQKMDIPAGYLESSKSQNLTRLIGKFRTIEELENIIVRSNFSGNKIYIKDVAVVNDSFEKEKQKGYIYDSFFQKDFKLKPSVSLTVFKTLEKDLIDITDKVKQVTEKFKKILPASYKILTSLDDSRVTKKRLKSVINNALFGLVLIFLVFFVCLPSRIGLIASCSLPLALLGTFALLPSIGVSFNIITMLAFIICIGMLVDNSVVIAEYYARLTMEQNVNPKQASLQVTEQFFKPITATILTTIVAFLPMLVTTGVMGQFIQWVPIVVTLALLISLFEAFCLLPNRLQWFENKKKTSHQGLFFKIIFQLENIFEKLLKKCVQKKYLVATGLLTLLFSSFLLFKFGMKIDLFSSKSPEFYVAEIEVKNNLPLSLTDKTTKNIARQMQKVFEGEKNIEWMNIEVLPGTSEITLKVKPSVLRGLKYKNILEQLRKIEKGEFIQKLDFKTRVGGPPVGKALNIAVLSNDRTKIQNFIDKIYPEISQIEGLVNLSIDPKVDKGKEYKIHIKDSALAKLGLDFRSIGLALRTALEGVLISEITENNESFYIRVKHQEQDVTSIEDLKQIQVREIMGRQIPLGQIVDIQETVEEPDKKTYNFSPVIYIQSNINPKKTTSFIVNDKAREIVEREIKNYPSLNYKLIGEQETTKESLKSLRKAGGIAFFSILIILIFLFKSFTFSFLILSCIPLGLIGVIWSFFLHGRPLSFFAMIGIVGLAGVVVNSAIILISFITKLQKDSPSSGLQSVVVKASKIRFRPILITNLTTLGGLLPTAYGIPSFEPLLMPMTLALFWGLFTATIFTLIWIPCTLLIIEDIKSYFKKGS